MSTQDDSNRFEEIGRKVGKTVGDAVKNLDQESERMIAYLNIISRRQAYFKLRSQVRLF